MTTLRLSVSLVSVALLIGQLVHNPLKYKINLSKHLLTFYKRMEGWNKYKTTQNFTVKYFIKLLFTL